MILFFLFDTATYRSRIPTAGLFGSSFAARVKYTPNRQAEEKRWKKISSATSRARSRSLTGSL